MMNKNQTGEVLYLTFPSFDRIPSLYHAFSTRKGGVSGGIYSSMNLNFDRGDEVIHVLQNYTILCDAVGIDPITLVFSDQTHTSNIVAAAREDCGKGLVRPKTWKDVDGLVTKDPEVSLVTLYADCVPLFFADPVKRVVATAHAGWKGTVLAIASKMVDVMKTRFLCDPKDILVGIGPSIGICCFEVDETTADAFQSLPASVTEGCIRKRSGSAGSSGSKYDISLQEINRNLLLQAGVTMDHIEIADICTKCNHEWLFSHRATNGQRGGMAAIIGLKK